MSSTPGLTPAQLNYAETAQWKEILRQALVDLRVSIPAIVQSFDAATQTVTVQIAIREIVRTPNGPVNKAIYPISNVPVCFPSAGGFSLTLPVQAGDEGMLVFCDMCIDLWFTRGGIQNQFERRRHDLTDCGFFPAGRSQPRALSGYSTSSAQLRNDAGTAYVELAAGGVVNILAPGGLNINGNAIVTGGLAVDGSLTGSGGGTLDTGPISATGAIAATGEVIGNGIPLSTHLHPDVQTGSSNTGAPIP